MEISPTTVKPPKSDTQIHPAAKPISLSNGVLKRHSPTRHHHHNTTTKVIPVTSLVVSYKECLKNHAASLGGHALDGCGEFMPSPTSTKTDPTSLKCAACGCHRNFHRREPDDSLLPGLNSSARHVIEYQPHHRHHPPPPPLIGTRSPSASPPPISSSFYPSAPHMLLNLSTGISDNPNNHRAGNTTSNGRKRFRTKFNHEQKDKMWKFAERLGWKMQKRDENIVRDFCNEIGVEKAVLKVWMHNNKNTAKRDSVLISSADAAHVNNGGINATTPGVISKSSNENKLYGNMNGNNTNNNKDEEEDNVPGHHRNNDGGLSSLVIGNHDHYQVGRDDHPHGVANGGGSSSSS